MPWQASLFGLVLGLSVFGVGWATSPTGMCATDDAARMEMAKAMNCFEFWLNRYQAVVAALLALASAIAAIVWVQKQVSVANQQLKIAGAQLSIVTLTEFVKIIGEGEDILKRIEDTITQFEIKKNNFLNNISYISIFGSFNSLRIENIISIFEDMAVNETSISADEELSRRTREFVTTNEMKANLIFLIKEVTRKQLMLSIIARRAAHSAKKRELDQASAKDILQEIKLITLINRQPLNDFERYLAKIEEVNDASLRNVMNAQR